MGIKELDEHVVKAITKEIMDCIQVVGMKYGLNLHIGNADYNNTSFVLHLQGVLNDIECTGKVRVERQKHWEAHCDEIGMHTSDFGLKMNYNGHEWEITGLDLTQRENPIILQNTADFTAVRTSKEVIDYIKQCNGLT